MLALSLPEPPSHLAEWLVLVGLIAASIEAARRRMIYPILHEIREHSDAHATMQHQIVDVAPELEAALPYSERRRTLRELAVLSRIGILGIEADLIAHRAFTLATIQKLNEDRAARGLPLLDPEALRQPPPPPTD